MILRHYGGGESYPASQSVRVEGYEKPLRRSKREKRLLFATFNVSQMDKQNFNAAHGYHDDLSEVRELYIVEICYKLGKRDMIL